MSQKADAVPALVTPTVKGMGKATAAILISLVSIGAFVGAGVGTYVTFRYVILPSFQGSNGNDSNNNKKTAPPIATMVGTLDARRTVRAGLGRSPPGGVTMTITQYGYSSQYFNFTFTVSSSETMNSLTVTNGSTSICSGTAPSGQGTYASANTPTKISNGLSDNGCSSATFQSGTTYSWTFGDTNGHSFSGFSLKY